jgi:hypothetical protein
LFIAKENLLKMAEAFDSGMEVSDLEASDIESLTEDPVTVANQNEGVAKVETGDKEGNKPSTSGKDKGQRDRLAGISPIRSPAATDEEVAGPSRAGPSRPLRRIEFVPPLESSSSSGSEIEMDNQEYRRHPKSWRGYPHNIRLLDRVREERV